MKKFVVGLILLLATSLLAQQFPPAGIDGVLGSSGAYLDENAFAGLIRYHRMNEAGSTDRVDVFGGNPWTVEGGTVSGVAGKNGNGASVSMGNNLVIATQDLFPAGTWTFVMWASVSARNNGSATSALLGSTSVAAGLDIYFNWSLIDNNLIFVYYSSSASQQLGALLAPASGFHFVAITRSATQCQIRIDNTTFTANTGTFVRTGNNMRLSWPVTTGASFIVDEMMVFSGVLSKQALDRLYNGGTGVFLP